MTYTYSVLRISRAAYDEIKDKLKNAEYDHAFHEDDVIDMHGIALKKDPSLFKCVNCGGETQKLKDGSVVCLEGDHNT